MGHSNYTLTTEQKRILDRIADDIISDLKNDDEHRCLDVHDTPDGKLDRDKLTAIVWYIGDQLASY
jgi:hypothetical protein